MNNVILIGRLTKDAELSYLPSTGTAKAVFILAVNRDFKNKNGERDTDFIPVEFMGKKAENLVKFIKKGSLVAINGSLRIDRYVDESGDHKSYAKIFGNNIQFLDSKKDKEDKENKDFVPNFDTSDFQAVEDDDVPF